jgi:dTDP-4-dehydrorhamnose 3,5-epimerase-like enzyme
MSISLYPTISDDCEIIQLPKIHDPRGNLTFIEGQNHISFKIKRSYWIYDVPGGEIRGGHAYKKLHELIVAVSGSFDVVLDDGREKRNFALNRSYYGLYVPNLIWRSLENFSTNSLCLILASEVYNEDEYIRDYNEFLEKRNDK